MAARYLLDSNVLILHLRESEEVVRLLTQWAQRSDLYISVATRTEIMAGMRPREQAVTMSLLDSLINLPVTVPIADRAGRWLYDYGRQGVQLSFADSLIAATAVEHELTLVTINLKHFPMLEQEQVQALNSISF
ncbi:MAG: type II toxin-antitoxin system VapC family toxin [Anaerolineae bacterium]